MLRIKSIYFWGGLNMKYKAVLLLCCVVAIMLFLGCRQNESKDPVIGQVTSKINDNQAIQDVINSYYGRIENFDWESFNKQDGLEYWTEEGKTDQINNSIDKLQESVQRQKITSKLDKVETKDIKINDGKATAVLVTHETLNSETNEVLRGQWLSQEQLELIKIDNIWKINKRTSQRLKIPN
jgi:hypothetical protein